MRQFGKYAIALTAALGVFPIALDSTIVNVAIVPISKALGADVQNIQWIFIGYLLANGAVIALSGYLANRAGTKRLFLLGLACFTIFSFLCGLAPNERWLIGLRVLQGIGGGFLMPLGIAIALEPFGSAERGKAMATVAIPVLLAPVAGPIVGGLIIDHWSWQAIFFVNVPIGALGIALAGIVLPADANKATDKRAGFDFLGLLLSSLGIVAVIYAFKLVSQMRPHTASALQPQGTIYGWGYWPVWALAGGGVALLAIFAWHSLRQHGEPMLDLRLFGRSDFAISNFVIWVAGMVGLGALFLVPVYLQGVHQPALSALDTGIALLPLGVGTLVGMALGGGLYNKTGPRTLVLIGALLLGIGSWQLSHLTPATTASDLWPWLALLGLGITVPTVAAQTLALQTFRGAALNTASSLLSSTKLLVGTVGSAVLVTFYVQRTMGYVAQLSVRFDQAAPAGSALDLRDPRTAAAYQHVLTQAGTSGMADVFGMLVVGAVALGLLALALPGRRDVGGGHRKEAAAERELVGTAHR